MNSIHIVEIKNLVCVEILGAIAIVNGHIAQS